MIASSTFSALGSFLMKCLFMRSPTISPYEIVYWASLILLLVFVPIMIKMKQSIFLLPKKHRTTLVFRGVIGVLSNTFMITSLRLIHMTKSTVIYWTIPIFTAIFANIHLKERIT